MPLRLQDKKRLPKMSKIQNLAVLKSSAGLNDIGPAYTNWTQAMAAEGDKAKLLMLESQFDDFTREYKNLDAGVEYKAAMNA